MFANNISVSLTAVGDIMLGDSAICVGFGFHSRYPGTRAREAFESVRDQLSGSDVVFGNLECSLAVVGQGSTRWHRDQMRGDAEYAPMLRGMGFTALSVANNHAAQHGHAAFDETVVRLQAANILCVGVRGSGPWACEPAIQKLPDGRRIGLLGYCRRPRQYGWNTPPFAEGTFEEVLADIDRLHGLVDAIIVSLHWGEEFVELPSVSEVTFGRALIEAGALAVLGHHPHVLRPCERIAEGIIAYSLGNCASDMVWQDILRSGGILNCAWENGRLQDSTLTPTLLDMNYRPIAGMPSTIGNSIVCGLEEDAYRQEAERTLRAQRIAAYKYAVTCLLRYPPDILASLALTTARNKFDALRQLFVGRLL